jgi:xylulokinase
MAKPRYLIGVDLGTSATKTALYRADGALIAEASADVPLRHPAPGVVEQDQEDFYASAAATVRRVLTASGIEAREVAAIGFDSQMAGIGSVDEDFRPATRFDSWLDMRCQPYIEALQRDHGELVTRLTGCPPTSAHAPKMLWWRNERPEDYARIAKFVVPAGFVAGRLAGMKAEDAFIDYTFLHFTGVADARQGAWSEELTGRLGIDPARLPRIVAPGDVIGETATERAADFGLPPGVPIVAGAGDTAASALGAGIVRPGMLFDVAGTASVLAACTETFVADTKTRTLLAMHSIVPGLWHPLAYIGGGGLALSWFRDTFLGRSRAGGDEGDRLYDELTHEAADVPPGADGLFFSPHLGGRICPADPARRGSWRGFSWGHKRAHFFRAILESVAFEYASYLSILDELVAGLEHTEARVVGGGARSPDFSQIKADVLGVPYRRLPRDDIATWGVALVAGHAVGLIADVSEAAARASLPKEPAISPRPGATEAYRPIVRDYVEWQRTMDRA